MNKIESICRNKIYAVIRIEEQEKAYEISKALINGGIKSIEIPLLNINSIGVIKKLKADFPNENICAGGIITTRQAKLALEASADVLVSPVFQMNLVKFSQSYGVPIIMAASTANEAYEAWKARVPLIKIYPTKPLGGVEYIEDLLRPMKFLNVMATGGVQVENFTDYLESGAGCVGIGRDFYKNLSVEEVEKKAKNAVSTLKQYMSRKV